MSQSDKNEKKLTPLMKQYGEIKSAHPKDLLLFRMGDFYELFGEDAKKAAEVLNITLTHRNKKSGDDTLMCGFPHHAKEGPINRLLEAGFSVALCDQLEDPKEAKGIVKRGVTLILSPGVVYDPFGLDHSLTHELLCFNSNEVCWLEPSTGQAFFKSVKNESSIIDAILKINPKEIIVYDKEQADLLSFYKGSIVYAFDRDFLSLKDQPKDMLLKYVKGMQGEAALFGFTGWTQVEDNELLRSNLQFLKHLEVFETNEGEKEKSLFAVIKKTKTPGGTRLLRRMLVRPIKNKNTLVKRQMKIKEWFDKDFSELEEFRSLMGEMGDIERRVSRAGHGLGQPQDLLRLKNSLSVFFKAFSEKALELKRVKSLYSLLDQAIIEDQSQISYAKGGFIKEGFDKNLDDLIHTSSQAQSLVQELEQKEKEATGVNSLKIRFNSVFGFYIEITKTHKDKVPDRYIRKQTLTNSERYSTDELSELEEKVLTAKSKRLLLEKEIFESLKDEVRQCIDELKVCIRLSSEEDLFSSMAYLMVEKNFSLPEFSEDYKKSFVKGGFHPVVSEDLNQKGKASFTSNDLTLSEDQRVYLITGPNMAGKSTLMRMVILCSYMAQCGFPVPAKEAKLPLYDGLYTRIGASDALSLGLSTFMVEMKETAEILEMANEKSLLVLDEIGRGTSSKDGEALAESLLSFISKRIKCHCLFATHYHELTERLSRLDGVKNIHLGYSDKDGEIVFTYKIKEGASKKSYGIEVAELAGLPKSILKEAKILSEKNEELVYKSLRPSEHFKQLELSLSEETPLFIEELKSLDLNKMTPMDALIKLNKWKEASS
jgi:DNA mismatch repair protein MutS